jgi:hypothetical protein
MWPWAASASLIVLVLVAIVRFVVLQSAPVTDDENVYEFQARILASGRLYLDSVSPEIRPFFDNQYVVNSGKWHATYFMGHPSLLALAGRVGLGEWLGPIEAAITVLLACGIARRVFGCRTALLTGALLVVSPFFVTLSASHLSEPSSILMLSLFVYAVVRLESAPGSAVWWALAAASLSYAALIRPQAAVTFSIPFIVMLAIRWWRDQLRPGVFGPVVAGFMILVGAAVFLGINYTLTGNMLRTGYHAYLDQGHRWDAPFGPTHSIREISRALREVNFWLFGWPVSLVFVPFFERRRLAWTLAAASLALVVGYGVAAVPSVVVLGPVYYGEAIVPLAILTASGIERVVSRVRDRVEGRTELARWLLAWPLVATVGAFLTFVPAHLASLAMMASITRGPYDLVTEQHLDSALIFVQNLRTRAAPGTWTFFRRNPKPDLSDGALFVRDLGAERNRILIGAFPQRTPYVMRLQEGRLIVERLQP